MGKDKPRKGIQAGDQNTPGQHWRFLQLQFKNWKLSCMRGLNSWLGRPWTPISQLLAANTHFTTVNSWKPLQGSIQCLKSSCCTYTLTFQA